MLHFRRLFWASVVIWSAVTAAAQEGPFAPDAETSLLLHLDGDAGDAGGAENHGRVQGPVTWGEGRFGKALSLDGRGGVVIDGSGATHVGRRSWTVECWFRPLREQPQNAVLIASGWGYERMWYLQIGKGGRLTASFSGGHFGGAVTSEDASATLFDGGWHHVAAVLDRDRGGEVRLYLDGQRIPAKTPAYCPPILFDEEQMGIVIGHIAPWYLGKDGYRGLIDEVRVSATVRPAYAVAADSPPRPAPAWDNRTVPALDQTLSSAPLKLQPETTRIALPALHPAQGTFQAAEELQQWLRKGCGTTGGFEVVNEASLKSIEGQVILALGRTGWADGVALDRLSPDGFILQRRANVVCIAGAASQGTYHGAMRFLDDIGGVRFYLPTDLFTSSPRSVWEVPLDLHVKSEPFVRSGMISGLADVPGDGGWWCRNAAVRRRGGTHQHNMFSLFDPVRYAAAHPEIYPLLEGRRHIPADHLDQAWQPCLSATSLVAVAEDAAVRYFRSRPSVAYLACSVQDGHTVCQCEPCRSAYAKHQTDGRSREEAEAHGFSELYYAFIRRLAVRLQDRAPGKQLVALVYGPARIPPQEKMPPNVVLFTNFHIAELEADRILAADPATGVSPLDYVLRRCDSFGNHDWYHGNGFLIPRIYSGYWSRFMRHLAERVETAHMYAEAYPNWGLDGPKLSILTRLWWDPRQDVGVLLRQFCQDMFGPAADPMSEYFTALERLWMTLDNVKGPERKLFQWSRQFTADAEDLAVVRRCRTLLEQAASRAATESQKQRIALFAKTFDVPATLYEFTAAARIPRQDVTTFWQRIEQQILPDPLTLYGAGPAHEDLRKRIQAACDTATAGGKKIVDE